MSLRGAPAHPELVEGRGNLIVVATAVRRRVFDRYEIATSPPLLAMTAIIPSPSTGEGWGEGENPGQTPLRGAPAHPELVEGRGNLIVVATAVRRRVFDRYEIATSPPLLAMTAIIPSPSTGEGWGEGENPGQTPLRGAPAHPELVEGRGNLIVVATAVRRRVFDLIEIATSPPLLAMTAIIPSPSTGEGWGEGENPGQTPLRGAPAHPELVEGRGNLIVVATAVSRRVFDLIEIATSLTLSAMTAIIPSPSMGEGWGEGEFPRNDKGEGE